MAQKKNATRQWILGILCGVIMLASGLFLFYQELVRYDMTATATIHNEYHSQEFKPYFSYADFTDAEGNQYSIPWKSEKDKYPYKDGDTIEIFYHSEAPNICTQKGLWRAGGLLLRLAVPVIALVDLCRSIRGLQKAKEEDPETQQNR